MAPSKTSGLIVLDLHPNAAMTILPATGAHPVVNAAEGTAAPMPIMVAPKLRDGATRTLWRR